MAYDRSVLPMKINYVHQQFGVVMGTNSLFVKCVCVGVFVGYCLSFSERAKLSMCVIPGNLLPPNFWIWTCLSHNFIEVHWWIVLCDVVVVFLYGRLLEPLWGTLEMIIFFAVVNLSVVGLTTATYLIIYLITKDPKYLFSTLVHGLAGYLAGFSVAVKQTMPDHILINSPFGKLRNRHVPLLLLFAITLARLIGAVDAPFPIMFLFGSFVSWVYLRFYQRHSSGSRGDMADNFGLASFFPARLSPFISIISSFVFALLVRLKLCRTPQRKYDVSAPTTITVTLPGTSAQEVERRRILAIKALNDRLTSATSAATAWPSIVDGGAGTDSSSENLAKSDAVLSSLNVVSSSGTFADSSATFPSSSAASGAGNLVEMPREIYAWPGEDQFWWQDCFDAGQLCCRGGARIDGSLWSENSTAACCGECFFIRVVLAIGLPVCWKLLKKMYETELMS